MVRSGELDASQRMNYSGEFEPLRWHGPRTRGLTECWLQSSIQVCDLAWAACPPPEWIPCPGAGSARRGRLLPPGTRAPKHGPAAGAGGSAGVSQPAPEGGRDSAAMHHLPGEPQAADRGVVQPHDHGVEGQQVLVLLAAAGGGRRGQCEC